MKKNKELIGDILKCTDPVKVESKKQVHKIYNYLSQPEEITTTENSYHFQEKHEIFKRNATLIKIETGLYIDKDQIQSAIDYLRIKIHRNNPRKIGLTLIGAFPLGYGSLFVEESTLKEKKKTRSLYCRKEKDNVQ